MITFLIFATAMICAALYPLLRAGRGTERVASHEPRRGTAIVLGLFVPTTAVLLYVAIGRVDAVVPGPIDADRAMVEQMVAMLAARLEREPADANGWRKLATSYERLQRPAEAVKARERLVGLDPTDPDALVDLAEALSIAQGGRLAGNPIRHVRRALELDRAHARGLAMAANEALERNDPASAIVLWESLEARLPSDSPVARAIRANLVDARAALASRREAAVADRSGGVESPRAN